MVLTNTTLSLNLNDLISFKYHPYLPTIRKSDNL